MPRLGIHAPKHGKQRNEREQIDAVVLDNARVIVHSIFTP
jgi:hypothetical protein